MLPAGLSLYSIENLTVNVSPGVAVPLGCLLYVSCLSTDIQIPRGRRYDQ